MSWLEFQIQITTHQAELLSDLLESIGAVSVTFEDAADQAIFQLEPGAVSLWQKIIIKALFPENASVTEIIQKITAEIPLDEDTLKSITTNLVKNEDWSHSYQQHFQPIKFGKRLWIYPSWHQLPQNKNHVIVLDPGLAFGTGSHPTTALCLEWLDANVKTGDLVIDYGCGSGILALAALSLGAKQVWAIDHDPQAIQSTKENSLKNNYKKDNIKVTNENELPPWQADILVANILANPLIELAPKLASLVKNNGKIALSGILCDQATAVLSAYQPWFDMDEPTIHDEWVRLEGTKSRQ